MESAVLGEKRGEKALIKGFTGSAAASFWEAEKNGGGERVDLKDDAAPLTELRVGVGSIVVRIPLCGGDMYFRSDGL